MSTNDNPTARIVDYRAEFELTRAKLDFARAEASRKQAEIVRLQAALVGKGVELEETCARLNQCIERIRADGLHLDSIANGWTGNDSEDWQHDAERFIKNLYSN